MVFEPVAPLRLLVNLSGKGRDVIRNTVLFQFTSSL
jgi:hypothetical protein